MNIKLYMLALAVAFSTYAAPRPVSAQSLPAIEIVEFMVDPKSVTDARGEWVEVTNKSNDLVDLTGWDIDGSTINPGISITPGESVVICKNTDESLNGGVICDASSSFALNNDGDTVQLRDALNITVSSISYTKADISQGMSSTVDTEGYKLDNFHQYGVGDFGTPANNTFGYALVHSVIEKNLNSQPDFFAGETIGSGMTVNLYKIESDVWYFRNSTQTTGKNFPEAATFATSPGEYAACLSIPADHFATFAKEMTSMFVFRQSQVANQASTLLNDPLCSRFNVTEYQFTHHYFGAVKRQGDTGELRVHVRYDQNGDGLPNYDLPEPLMPGWKINFYKAEEWTGNMLEGVVGEVITTGKAYGGSAKFNTGTGDNEWIVCLEGQESYSQTYAITITSWVTYQDIALDNTSCGKIKVHAGQIRSVVFGVDLI